MKFDFQKLEVYKKAKLFHSQIRAIISKNKVTGCYNDQFYNTFRLLIVISVGYNL